MDNNFGISDYFPNKYGKLLGFSRGHNPSKSSSLLCEGPKHSNISIIFQLLKRYVYTSLTPASSINLLFTSINSSRSKRPDMLRKSHIILGTCSEKRGFPCKYCGDYARFLYWHFLGQLYIFYFCSYDFSAVLILRIQRQ